MSIGLVFWIIMLVWLLFSYVPGLSGGRFGWAGNLILFVLFLILGWAEFGAPIR